MDFSFLSGVSLYGEVTCYLTPTEFSSLTQRIFQHNCLHKRKIYHTVLFLQEKDFFHPEQHGDKIIPIKIFFREKGISLYSDIVFSRLKQTLILFDVAVPINASILKKLTEDDSLIELHHSQFDISYDNCLDEYSPTVRLVYIIDFLLESKSINRNIYFNKESSYVARDILNSIMVFHSLICVGLQPGNGDHPWSTFLQKGLYDPRLLMLISSFIHFKLNSYLI